MKKTLVRLGTVLLLLLLTLIPLDAADAAEKPTSPVSVELDLPKAAEGFAEGTVTVTLDPNSPAADLIELFWGAEDGKPLKGYGLLARIRPSGYAITEDDGSITQKGDPADPTVITLPEGLIIPDGAVSVLAFTENERGKSAYVAAPLPETAVAFTLGEPILEFQAVSDLHLTGENDHEHTRHVSAMLGDIARNSPDSVGIMAVGDIAHNGAAGQYKQMLSLASRTKNLPPVVYLIGNHDYIDGNDEFLDFVDNGGLWFDKWIDGYHFIYLALVDGDYRTPMPEEEVAWLREKLAEDADPTKPIFLFCHEGIINTVAGCSEEEDWWGITNGEEIGRILADYPQAIFFSGHTHWELLSENEYYPADERMCNGFNTASVGYLWTALDYVGGVKQTGSEGLYVTVYDNGVTLVQGRDFTTKKWVAGAQYAVYAPTDAPLADAAETEAVTETEDTESVSVPVVENEAVSFILPVVLVICGFVLAIAILVIILTGRKQ